ncbi:hypothetical protein OSB04_un001763 [Centaurea solstitialis]|uniref:DDE Tnp4 domain-containing protein n=1 Tax=Centaurea solstitialis TaxID=347529 RepID=A0AA38SFL0_9ASTR|nr:hypothetical protein OSB04_un001763 [Centaurea solstitialis]
MVSLPLRSKLLFFLNIIAHHTKNRCLQVRNRSGETISRHVHRVLSALLRLQDVLFTKPTPIEDDCTDRRWKWLKGCLRAINGTYIKVTVPETDKPRYRTRKGHIAINILGACTRDMKLSYILFGWEGSATDSRVLRDAVTRNNGLKVPLGNYYLADGGYVNGNGFLAPYRGTRYHLREWEHNGHTPINKEECFNMKHAQARNVIERCFGMLKKRWAVLRSPSFYPIKLQGRMVIACALLHNFTTMYMALDQEENTTLTVDDMPIGEEMFGSNNDVGSIDVVESKVEKMADRRNWTIAEEDLLIGILQDIVAAGAAYDMLNTNGFGWDDANKCVMVDEQVLDEYLKKHPSKNYIANKPFPQYERLKIVFGKDRATGSLAESAADAMEHINLAEVGAETEEVQVPLSNPSGGASESSVSNDGEASSKKRKRKTNFAEDVVKMLEKGLKSVSKEMSKLVATIGNPNPALKTLPEELVEMGFNSDQCIAISMYFADNPNQLHLYSGMNDNFKLRFVTTVLMKLDML